ncbi:MAG: sulfatase-like hydrolase/transferase, partial [Verrucomicrobiae bacterium]|nr:sulfatase-like hydrolase/transferase [Verrucomicrobiae bacterium]
GELLDHLEAAGLREKTLIIFQSDHGHSVEERTFGGGGSAGPYRGHKGSLFEGGLRVPSIVSLPGTLPEGEVRDQLVTGCDWWPTIAELTGAKVPKGHHLDGSSILPVIRSATAVTPHDRFYWQLGGDPEKAKWVAREGDWKLLGNASEEVRPPGVPELTPADRKWFLANVAEDPGETRNLAKEHPEIVERLLNWKQETAAAIQADLKRAAE